MIASLRRATAGLLLAATAIAATPVASQSATATIHADKPGPVYDRMMFTQFAEHLGTGIYGGLWVGNDKTIPNTRGFRNDVVAALKELGVPAVRWPGGCFADEYNWREGIGPQDKRPVRINTHWGGVTEPNAVGTHEFMDLVEQLGAEAYVAGNVGSGTPREMAQWVEYMTSPAGTLADERAKNGRKEPWKIAYFGVGNELWGCGGNMRPEFAADLTRQYATFIKTPKDTKIIKIAAGANNDDFNWTETFMRVAKGQIDALSLHYYTIPKGWPPRTSASDFDEALYAETLVAARRMDSHIAGHIAAMDKHDPEKKIWLAVDEWGTWFQGDPGTNPGFLRQQNTMRDALVASVHFDIFAKHAERVKMSAIAQMVNVLQTMIFTDGPKMVLTPTYHVFHMYKPYMDATVLPIEINAPTYSKGEFSMPAVSGSAVRAKDGKVYVGLSNLDPNKAHRVTVTLSGLKAGGVSGQLLTAPAINSLNSFAAPNTVRPVAFKGASISGGTLTVELPSKSVVMLELK